MYHEAGSSVNRVQEPNRTENFGSFSVPGSQEPKFSVWFGSWTRLIEEPASWYIQPINYLSPLEHRPNCAETLVVRLSLSPSPSPTPVSQSQPPIPHSALPSPSLPPSPTLPPSLPARRRHAWPPSPSLPPGGATAVARGHEKARRWRILGGSARGRVLREGVAAADPRRAAAADRRRAAAGGREGGGSTACVHESTKTAHR